MKTTNFKLGQLITSNNIVYRCVKSNCLYIYADCDLMEDIYNDIIMNKRSAQSLKIFCDRCTEINKTGICFKRI